MNIVVVGPELGAVFADLHREHVVDLRLDTSIDTMSGSDVVLGRAPHQPGPRRRRSRRDT